MKEKIKTICLVIIVFFVFLIALSSTIEARQGCCSWHGGVCSYTCPDGINVGHMCCDGTSLSATCAPYYSSCPPVSTSKPKPAPTPKTDYTILTTASAEVIRVVDGDTIEVKFTDGTIEKVRLIGIDTPETVDPRKPVECFGKEASAKMKELVEGKTAKLERKEDENRGVYGRLLRYVYVGDLFINAEMIKQGYAYAYIKYPFDSKLMEEFKQYEREAREKELGLWSPDACVEVATPITQEEEQGSQPLSADISEAVGTSKDVEDTGTSEGGGWGWLWILILAVIGGIGYYIYSLRRKTNS